VIVDATKQEADALLDLLDKANRAHGLNVSYWCLHWAQKIKAAEAKAATEPAPVNSMELLKAVSKARPA